jgi:CRP-like cAMP-binding protein
MEKIIPILKICPLFDGISDGNLLALLNCVKARRSVYDKNDFICVAGDEVSSLCVVIAGEVHVMLEDYWGGRAIIACVGPGELFAEAFSCAGIKEIPVSVMASERSEILFVDFARAVQTCSSSCEFHSWLVRNMLRIIALKNVSLTRKIEHVTRRTTREKLLSYLSERAKIAGSSSFDIPFSRQELADYLSVERSAMSGELSKMRGENILRCEKNHFELL